MSKKENLDKDIDLKNFDDGGVSLREMNFGLWLSQKRRLFIKLITIVLIAISAFFFVFSTYNYIVYFLAGDPNNQSLVETFVSSPRKITDDLVVGQPDVFSGADRTDIAVLIQNPNEKFMATFHYCFQQAENNLICHEGFIMPQEEKYVTALGLEVENGSAGITFNLSEVFWRRIDPRKVGDWATYLANRLNFEVSDLEFVPGGSSSLSEKINLNTMKFSLTNKSAYGYYEAPFDIMFFRGTALQGVNRVQLNNFLPGEKRDISLSWPGNLFGVTRTEIKPSINIMNENSYLPYRGEENR